MEGTLSRQDIISTACVRCRPGGYGFRDTPKRQRQRRAYIANGETDWEAGVLPRRDRAVRKGPDKVGK
jgi:hypothetical protein